MTALVMLAVSVAAIVLLGRRYSRYLARQWGEDSTRQTPAVVYNDGRDYVPTPTPVVFAHHFASIAGAGPIVGPVLALCFGWLPALLWVVLGGLFVGAVHDYLAAFMSIRNRGQSVAMIARRLLGRGPFVALILFLVLLLGLVTAVFLNTSASALVSMLDFGRIQLAADQSIFRTVVVDGQQKVVIGGVASMSVIVITCFAPLVGWLYIRRQVAVWKCSLLAIAICAASIVAGVYQPVTLTPQVWKLTLAAYTLIAAGVPVWLFLQSRDFINVHILYAGILFLVASLVVGSLRSVGVDAVAALPALDLAAGTARMGGLWPVLFITIACGAVSGFHSLCAGGTTCKQLKTESATRMIGYWGMLLESLLAVAVIGTLVMGTTQAFYLQDVFPAGQDNNPVLGFAFAVGRAGFMAFGVPVAVGALAGMLLLEGFVITTLDTAVRLNRYLIEELWQEISVGFKRFYWVNSGLAVALMLWLSFSGSILQLWNIFATANQLLAAFSLGIGCIWLLRNRKPVWYIVAPALFMLATTAASLILLVRKFMPGRAPDGAITGNPTLFVADIVLMALTGYLVIVGIAEIARIRRAVPLAGATPACD